MPFPNISVPAFPNVPFAAGVPPVLRSSSVPPAPNPVPSFADGVGVSQAPQALNWGIYDQSGNLVLAPTSIATFSFMNEFRISDYPIEEGGFESYNKVATPFDVRVMMTKGGKEVDRTAFLGTLANLVSSLDLVNVVTPDHTYLNANIIRYDYDRSSKNGVTLLSVSVHLREVRAASPTQTASSVPAPLVDTQVPSGVDPIPVGTKQAHPGTPIQQHMLDLLSPPVF